MVKHAGKPKVKLAMRKKKNHGPRNVEILGLKMDYCRWIKSSGLYCAADVKGTLPYCHGHCMIAYPRYRALHPELTEEQLKALL